MAEWWNSLTLLGQVLACIAVPSTLIMLIQLVMMLTGMGDDGDASDTGGDFVDIDGDGIPDGIDINGDGIPDNVTETPGEIWFKLLTFRGIIAFFAMFGWSGLVFLKSGLGTTLSLVIAFLIGFAVMVAVGFAFKLLYRLQSDGSINIKNALGVSGSVYLRVPASRKGEGKVNVVVQGAYGEFSAVTDEEKPLEYGEAITVVGVSGQNTLVVKRK